MPWARHGAGVGQEDNVRLQSLGAMHRHHADLAQAMFQVALDLSLPGGQPVQEPLQRGDVLAFIVEGEG